MHSKSIIISLKIFLKGDNTCRSHVGACMLSVPSLQKLHGPLDILDGDVTQYPIHSPRAPGLSLAIIWSRSCRADFLDLLSLWKWANQAFLTSLGLLILLQSTCRRKPCVEPLFGIEIFFSTGHPGNISLSHNLSPTATPLFIYLHYTHTRRPYYSAYNM